MAAHGVSDPLRGHLYDVPKVFSAGVDSRSIGHMARQELFEASLQGSSESGALTEMEDLCSQGGQLECGSMMDRIAMRAVPDLLTRALSFGSGLGASTVQFWESGDFDNGIAALLEVCSKLDRILDSVILVMVYAYNQAMRGKPCLHPQP
jgi:hypothetical protein